jgi:hypothetical protein
VAKPLAVVPDLESELDELYALAPGEFTRARNDLVRRLKQAGQSEAAATIQGLRKPTVPLWTVNQLARGHPKEIEALLEAGEQLRVAQKEALGGGEPQALRSATSAERQALRGLTHRAQDLLTSAGHPPTAATLERIASTLRAAAVDPEGRELLAAGRLNDELESSGFGALEGMPVRARSPRRQPQPKREPSAVDRRREQRLSKLRDRVSKLDETAATAEREAADAAAAAGRARKNADRAREAADAVRAQLEAAERSGTTRR